MIIELFGMSRSGKSTQKMRLLDIIKKRDESVLCFERPPITFKEAGGVEGFHYVMYDSLMRTMDSYDSSSTDHLILDRGFYDRLILLETDREQVSDAFYGRKTDEIKSYLGAIEHPLMLLVPPEISLARWDQQIEDGLDSSHMNKGMDTKDNMAGLEYLHGLYTEMAKTYTDIKTIDCTPKKDIITERISSLIDF